MTNAVTKLPARLEPFGDIGWTVFTFPDARAAASWFLANPQARMPCWQRLEVIDGQLVQVR